MKANNIDVPINPKSNLIYSIASNLNLKIDYNNGISIYTDNSILNENKKNEKYIIPTHNNQTGTIINRICKKYYLIIKYLMINKK